MVGAIAAGSKVALEAAPPRGFESFKPSRATGRALSRSWERAALISSCGLISRTSKAGTVRAGTAVGAQPR